MVEAQCWYHSLIQDTQFLELNLVKHIFQKLKEFQNVWIAFTMLYKTTLSLGIVKKLIQYFMQIEIVKIKINLVNNTAYSH